MGTSVSLCRAPPPAWGPASPGANREAVFCSQANRRPVSTIGQMGPQTRSLEPARLPMTATWRYCWLTVPGPFPGGCPGAVLIGGSAGGLSQGGPTASLLVEDGAKGSAQVLSP